MTLHGRQSLPAGSNGLQCYLFGTSTTEITRNNLGEDETILFQVIATAREPRLQKELTHYKNETGCLCVGLPWIHVTDNMDTNGHIACSGDTTGSPPFDRELGLNPSSLSALVGPTSEDAAAGARGVPAPSFLRLVRPPE